MKKTIYSILALTVIGFTSCSTAEEPVKDEAQEETIKEVEVEEELVSGTFHTAEGATITWRAKHNQDEDFVHVGTVPAVGTVVVENNKIIGGNFSFDILNLDKDGEGSMDVKLENHLKEPGFFDVDVFPNATFSITKVTDDKVTGELEIIGFKKEITLDAKSHVDDGSVHVFGSVMVDFLTFGMENLVIPEGSTDEEISQSPDSNISITFDFLLEIAK